MISSGGISSFWIGSGQLYSQTASEVIESFPNPLADGEATKIARWVDASQWDNYDFIMVPLTDPDNALHDWKNNVTPVAVNGPTYEAGKGYLGNGTDQCINLNFIPSVDGVNFKLNDAFVSAYCYENLDGGNNKALVGANNIGTTDAIWMNQIFVSTRITYYINSTASGIYTGQSSFQNDTRYEIHRDDSANQELYIDGVLADTEADASTGLPTVPIHLLCRNNNGSPVNHINARIGYTLIGGGISDANRKADADLLQSLFIV